jgi:anti-sigma factor RsiW
VTTCIGEPVSWPQLERFVAGAADAAIAAHLAACPACRQCVDQIRDDVVALRPLDVPVAARPVRRRWLAPAIAAAAAAAVVLVVVGLRPAPEDDRMVLGIKGVGEVTVELVRERGGELSFEARRYAPGDRWKVVVSCPPRAHAWIDVSVADDTSTAHPLAPEELACGNRVIVPGAFTITGRADNRVCAAIAAGSGAQPETGCVTLRPE